MLMIMGIEMNVNPIYAKTAYFDIVCFPGDGVILRLTAKIITAILPHGPSQYHPKRYSPAPIRSDTSHKVKVTFIRVLPLHTLASLPCTYHLTTI